MNDPKTAARYSEAVRFVTTRGMSRAKFVGGGAYGVVVGCTVDRSYEPCNTAPQKWSEATADKKRLAVKTMQDWGAFDREVAFTRKLRHTNVMEVLDWFTSNQESCFRWMGCMVLECMHMTLHGLCRRAFGGSDGRFIGLPPSVFGSVAAQVLEGLAHIHEAGVLHRDIKPDNLFVYLFDDEEQASAEMARRFGNGRWVVDRINRSASNPLRRLSPLVWLRIGDFGLATCRPAEGTYTGTGNVITSTYRPSLLMVQQGHSSFEFPAHGRKWRLAEAPGGPLRCVDIEKIHRRALRAALRAGEGRCECDLSNIRRTWWTTDRVPLGEGQYAEAVDSYDDSPTGVEMSNCAYGSEIDVFSAGASLAFAVQGYDVFLPSNHALAWADMWMSDYSVLLTQQCILGDVRSKVGAQHPVVRRMSDDWWYSLPRVPALSDEDRRRLFTHVGTSVRTATRQVGATNRTVAECVATRGAPDAASKAALVAKLRGVDRLRLADETERAPLDDASSRRLKLDLLENLLLPHPDRRWSVQQALDRIARWCAEDVDEACAIVADELWTLVVESMAAEAANAEVASANERLAAEAAANAEEAAAASERASDAEAEGGAAPPILRPDFPCALWCPNCTVIYDGLHRFVRGRLRSVCFFRQSPGCCNKRLLALDSYAEVERKRRHLACDLQ